MLTRGCADEGNIEAWHHGRWAWVGNRSCSRNCIFQQIFTITFWYCCVTHSHRFHLAYLPAVRVGSLTPWPFQCLRKNLFRTGKSTKNYRDILTSLSSEAMQILGSVVVSWKYVVANIRRLLVANPTENWEKSSRKSAQKKLKRSAEADEFDVTNIKRPMAANTTANREKSSRNLLEKVRRRSWKCSVEAKSRMGQI